MMNTRKNMDVNKGIHRLLRAAALLTATGAMVLMTTGTAAGQQATAPAETAPAPTTQPSMIESGVGSDGSIRLTAGKSTIINFRRMYKTISIGNTEVADVNHVSPTSLLVTAKKPGTTALVIFDDENRSVVIDVAVDPDLALLQRQMKLAFPNLDVTVTPLNDTLALHGTVPNVQTGEQIVEMAGTYGKVHNFMTITGGQQVMLQVRFAEVSKTAMRNLGVTFGGTDGVTTFSTNGLTNAASVFGGTSPALTLTPAQAQGGVTIFGQGRFGVAAFNYFISALKTDNLVRVLAEPNLTCTSGQTASFLAGGQIPIPVPQPGSGGNTVTIEYKDYGVNLAFTPQVLGDGKIRLKVAPEVSDLDYSTAVTIGGVSVPGLTDRKVDTSVELSDGQSFALAGLLQAKVSSSNTAIPVLGDLPVLGTLFRSVNFQRSETELVILVTPRLVSPLNPDQVPGLPGEKWRYPTLGQLYLRHDLGGPVVEDPKAMTDSKTAGPAPQFHGSYGFTAVGCGTVAPVDMSSAQH
jgi:pilus assembly protein CpaC